MNPRPLVPVAVLSIILAPLSAPAQNYMGSQPKASPAPAKAAAKPADWKATAPDTKGLTFKGQKTVQLRVFSDANGRITKADIDKSSGDPALDKRVADHALKNWTGPANSRAKIPITLGGLQ